MLIWKILKGTIFGLDLQFHHVGGIRQMVINPSNMKNGICTTCRWVAPAILAVTALLLLLFDLGVFTGTFAEWVATWWPAGLLLYALAGFCPCRGDSCCK